MKALAIIPARGGSKGIPDKNIRSLGGKPLLAYTAEAARASGIFSRVILSTDSERIAEVGRAVGIEVPFMRPPELASDSAPTLPVLQHAARFMTGIAGAFDVVCTLQPTTPFRDLDAMKRAVEALAADPTAESAVAVSRVPAHMSPDYVMKIEEGELRPFLEGGAKITRRQDARAAYVRNGEFYFTRMNTLMEGDSIYGKKCLAIITPDRLSVNLDTLEDWKLAELLVGQNLVQTTFQ